MPAPQVVTWGSAFQRNYKAERAAFVKLDVIERLDGEAAAFAFMRSQAEAAWILAREGLWPRLLALGQAARAQEMVNALIRKYPQRRAMIEALRRV